MIRIGESRSEQPLPHQSEGLQSPARCLFALWGHHSERCLPHTFDFWRHAGRAHGGQRRLTKSRNTHIWRSAPVPPGGAFPFGDAPVGSMREETSHVPGIPRSRSRPPAFASNRRPRSLAPEPRGASLVPRPRAESVTRKRVHGRDVSSRAPSKGTTEHRVAGRAALARTAATAQGSISTEADLPLRRACLMRSSFTI